MQQLNFENLNDLSGLTGLADSTGVDIQPTLLRVLTDLYVQKLVHTPEEERHYRELALRLIDVVDPGVCEVIASRLAVYPGAATAVRQKLARRLSPGVSFDDRSAPTDARQEDDMHATPPAPSNHAAGAALEKTFEAPQAAGAPADAHSGATNFLDLRDTFFGADAADRRLILLNLDYIAAQHVAIMSEGTNLIRYIEQAALAGRLQEFTTLLQQSLGLSRASASRIVSDPSGEPFVVAAKALAMPLDAVQRILLFLNPSVSHSVQRVYDLCDLFKEISPQSALQLLAIWRHADRTEFNERAHRPTHWDDTRSRAREFAAHNSRPAGTNASTQGGPLSRRASKV